MTETSSEYVGHKYVLVRFREILLVPGVDVGFEFTFPVGTTDCGVAVSPDNTKIAVGLRVFDAKHLEQPPLFDARHFWDQAQEFGAGRFWTPQWTSSDSLVVKADHGERIRIDHYRVKDKEGKYVMENGEHVWKWSVSVQTPYGVKLKKRNKALICRRENQEDLVFALSGRFIDDLEEAQMLLNHTTGPIRSPYFESVMWLRRKYSSELSHIFHKILEYRGLAQFWLPLASLRHMNLGGPADEVVGVTFDDEFQDDDEVECTWTPRGTLVVMAPSRKDVMAMWEFR